MLTQPEHVLVAAAHHDPYPFYTELVVRTPFAFHTRLNLWVAAGAHVVQAVLGHPQASVRPLAEPIPNALRDTPVAPLYRHLVRMRDDPGRLPLRSKLLTQLTTLAPDLVAKQTATVALILEARAREIPASRWLGEFILRLPVFVMASLFGVPEADLPQVASWLHDLVVCLRPGADPAALMRGSAAATALRTAFAELGHEQAATPAREEAGLRRLAADATSGMLVSRVSSPRRAARQA